MLLSARIIVPVIPDSDFSLAIWSMIKGLEIALILIFFGRVVRNFLMNFGLSSFAFDVPSKIRWFPWLWSLVIFIVKLIDEI